MFGSYSRHQEKPECDIDILIEFFERPRGQFYGNRNPELFIGNKR
jgi:predicted nucleotidyltransferase